MSGKDGTVHHSSEHGIAASHPARDTQPLLVAPATGTEFNVLGLDLVAVACLGFRDISFAFDSAFVNPEAALVLSHLPVLREKHKSATGELPRLSIFGHADPVGKDEYNKQLSGRRAKGVYGLVTHKVEFWEELYISDNWVAKGVDRSMLKALGKLPSSTMPRKQLIDQYMTLLFPSPLQKTDFVGQGADPQGKADYQGCSDFNPLVVLSRDENDKLSHAERNRLNQPDRRVVVFLFTPGPKVNPSLWPCPRASEGTAECRTRFFVGPPKGDDRRKAGPEHKEFVETHNTFACRFYDRFAHYSPCEQPSLVGPVTITPSKTEFVVVLDKDGNVPAAYPLLKFDIQGPPNLQVDVQVARRHSNLFSASPGLSGSWDKSKAPKDRRAEDRFSSWTNGDTSLRLDGSGKASYEMPLEWWRDLGRQDLANFDTMDVFYRAIAFPDPAGPLSFSTPDNNTSTAKITIRNNLTSFTVTDLGYIEGGIRKSIRMEFKVREANTTDMYTIVQWMQGSFNIWDAGKNLSHGTHLLYDIVHEGNFPDFTIDRLHTDPRYWDGVYTISDGGKKATATDAPGGPIQAGFTHEYAHIDFETRLHLNFEVPATVHITRKDGSPPVFGVVTGIIDPPEPIILKKETWNTRVLQAPGGAVTHPDTFAGP